ncbi:MAG: hypothetical protein ACPGUV_06945 [Polyangiales bacterium]
MMEWTQARKQAGRLPVAAGLQSLQPNTRASWLRALWLSGWLCSSLVACTGGSPAPSSSGDGDDETQQSNAPTPPPGASDRGGRREIRVPSASNASGSGSSGCHDLARDQSLHEVTDYGALRALCQCYVERGPTGSITCSDGERTVESLFPVEDCAAELSLVQGRDCAVTVGDVLDCAEAEREESETMCQGEVPAACEKVLECMRGCE